MDIVKNIIVVCDFAYPKAGSEKVAIESSVGLAQEGKKILYFCGTGPIDSRLNNENIKVVCLKQTPIIENKSKLNGMIQGTWNRKAKKEFEKVLDEFDNKDTIIHIHLWQKTLSGSFLKAAQEKKFKVVFTMHHYFLACPNGGFFNYQKYEICEKKAMGIKCLTTHCDSRNYAFKVWRCARLGMEQKIGKSLEQIKDYIYISELGKKALEPYLNEKSNYYYIPNPINIKKQEYKDSSKNSEYIFVGRLAKEKGVILLAKVAKELNLKITFVGEGDCRKEIEEIYPKAKITGWVSKEEVNKYVENARALLFPSLWYEGMPLSVMESLALGIPVIATETCAASEIIEENINGMLFRNNDFNDLKKKILMLEDNEYVSRISKNAYDLFWENDYSIDNHVSKLISTYNEVLKRQED